jgi:6,7-dimethyl-8-ribityllumazine synthase
VSGRMTNPDETPDASAYRFAIIVSSFHRDITERLLAGARECLAKHGAPDVDAVWVPGAFELPLAAQLLARSGRYDALVCLGCVIRGDTPHFEYVSAASASGLQDAALRSNIPMAFGVLTTDDREQAESRAGGAEGNKGWDAALTAIAMAALAAEARTW